MNTYTTTPTASLFRAGFYNTNNRSHDVILVKQCFDCVRYSVLSKNPCNRRTHGRQIDSGSIDAFPWWHPYTYFRRICLLLKKESSLVGVKAEWANKTQPMRSLPCKHVWIAHACFWHGSLGGMSLKYSNYVVIKQIRAFTQQPCWIEQPYFSFDVNTFKKQNETTSRWNALSLLKWRNAKPLLHKHFLFWSRDRAD